MRGGKRRPDVMPPPASPADLPARALTFAIIKGVAEYTGKGQTEYQAKLPRSYLLTGMLRCGRCGNKLFSALRDQDTRRYVCLSGPDRGGCGRLTVVAEPVEALITEAVLFRLDTTGLADAIEDRVHVAERDIKMDPGRVEPVWRL